MGEINDAVSKITVEVGQYTKDKRREVYDVLWGEMPDRMQLTCDRCLACLTPNSLNSQRKSADWCLASAIRMLRHRKVSGARWEQG